MHIVKRIPVGMFTKESLGLWDSGWEAYLPKKLYKVTQSSGMGRVGTGIRTDSFCCSDGWSIDISKSGTVGNSIFDPGAWEAESQSTVRGKSKAETSEKEILRYRRL